MALLGWLRSAIEIAGPHTIAPLIFEASPFHGDALLYDVWGRHCATHFMQHPKTLLTNDRVPNLEM